MNKKAKVAFDNLSTQQKTSFTKAYNKEHKDPTVGKRGKKSTATGAQDDIVSDSDEEKDQALGNLDEDELAEIKRAKQRERDRLQAKSDDKIEKFEMIKPVIKGEAKPRAAPAKKGKAKT